MSTTIFNIFNIIQNFQHTAIYEQPRRQAAGGRRQAAGGNLKFDSLFVFLFGKIFGISIRVDKVTDFRAVVNQKTSAAPSLISASTFVSISIVRPAFLRDSAAVQFSPKRWEAACFSANQSRGVLVGRWASTRLLL